MNTSDRIALITIGVLTISAGLVLLLPRVISFYFILVTWYYKFMTRRWVKQRNKDNTNV